MVQRNVNLPAVNPVIVVFGELGVVITAPPGPSICVQVPVSVAAGIEPVSDVLSPQTDVAAAFAVASVVAADFVTVTIASDATQPGEFFSSDHLNL